MRRERGNEYKFDSTSDSEWYHSFCVDTLLPEIKKNMPWLEGKDEVMQQQGETPHMGNNTSQVLNEEGHQRGWNVKWVTQPAQLPDLNINGMDFSRPSSPGWK